MNCLACGAPNTRVLETRAEVKQITRKRGCECGARWLTREKADLGSLWTKPISGVPVAQRYPQQYSTEPLNLPYVLSGSDLRSSSDPDGSPDLSEAKSSSNSNIMRPRAVAPFTVAIRAFCEAWRGRYGLAYVPTPKDLNQLRGMVGRLPAEVISELPGVFQRYVSDQDPFVAQAMRHSLAHFCTSGGFNKYRTTAPVLSSREARGLEAGRQFINGEGGNAGER